MIGQQVYSLALGYEDLNDQEFLRHDPLPSLLAGKQKLGCAYQKNCLPTLPLMLKRAS